MEKKKILFLSLLNSLALLLYIVGVGYIMIHGDSFFGDMPRLIGFVSFLLLFVFSATVCSLLFFSGPVYCYLEKNKSEAVIWLACNVMWLSVIMTMIFISRWLISLG